MSSDRRTCKSCGAELGEQQDWCLKCGRGTTSRGSIGPGWRSTAAAIAASAVLALGAAAAAYAALKESPKPAQSAVASTPPPTSPTMPAPSTAGSTPTGGTEAGAAPPRPGGAAGETPTTPAPSLPSTPTSPPKIPGSAKTPKGEGAPSGWPFGGSEGSKHKGNGQANNGGKGAKNGSEGKKAGTEGKQPGEAKESEEESNGTKGAKGKQGASGEARIPAKKAPILLDTNAASVYDPLHLPERLFSDPSLAIDGDVATAWKASIESGRSPKVGAGLIVNLRSAHNLAELQLMTSSKKMVVRIYGTKQRKPPHSLSSTSWVKLSGRVTITKRKTAIALGHSRESFRQVLLWIIEGNVESTSSSSTATSTSSTAALAPSTTTSGSATTASGVSTGTLSSSSAGTTSSTTTGESSESSVGEARVAEIELYERASRR